MIPVLLALLLGCPKPGSVADAVDWSATPRLPAATSGTYGQLRTPPPDPIVAHVVGSRPWDAYLAGAGTSHALAASRGPWTLSTWEIRESAWRAGWPYPIDVANGFHQAPDTPAPDDLGAWLATVDSGAVLGVVRARSGSRIAWVALASSPRVELGNQPRAVAPGDPLILPATPGARYRIADADGRVLEGTLERERRIELGAIGEWLVQVRDGDGLAAAFPVYVGVEPPQESLLPAAPEPLTDAASAATYVHDLLASVRDAYGLDAWSRDVLLDGVASRLELNPSTTLHRAVGDLGIEGPRHTWSCSARSVEACVDAWVWEPMRREALLSPALTHIGITTALQGDKVRIRVVLTGG